MPQFLTSTDADFDAAFAALLTMKREDSPDVDDVVACPSTGSPARTGQGGWS